MKKAGPSKNLHLGVIKGVACFQFVSQLIRKWLHKSDLNMKRHTGAQSYQKLARVALRNFVKKLNPRN